MAHRERPGKATADIRRPVWLILTFLAPALVLYLLFFVYPMFRSIHLSMYRGSPSGTEFAFVGLENFRTLLFHDSTFWQCAWHNFQFVAISGTATLVLSMALAVSLTHCGRGRSFFRVVFLFPNVMAVVAVAVLWSFVYNPSFGVLNAMLRLIGLNNLSRAWLGEPGTSLPALMVVQVWCQAGFYIVLFYAGLLRIPADYSEAARIDGASAWQEFRHVTLPLMTEILRIAAVYIIINSLGVFALVFLMNDGTPNAYNDVLLTYMYEQAFRVGNYGYSCAISVMMLVFVVGASLLVNLLFGQKSEEL